MPQLVTLSAVPYNPYNDSFAKFALEGLRIGNQQQQFNASLAQRQTEHSDSMGQQGVQNMFKGIQMQMERREFDHRVQNDLFNQEMKKEEFAWDKEKFSMQDANQDAAQELYQKKFDHEVGQDMFMRPLQTIGAASDSMNIALNAQKLQANQAALPHAPAMAKAEADSATAKAEMDTKQNEATTVEALKKEQEADTNYKNWLMTRRAENQAGVPRSISPVEVEKLNGKLSTWRNRQNELLRELSDFKRRKKDPGPEFMKRLEEAQESIRILEEQKGGSGVSSPVPTAPVSPFNQAKEAFPGAGGIK